MSSYFPPAHQLSPDQIAERAERYRAEREATNQPPYDEYEPDASEYLRESAPASPDAPKPLNHFEEKRAAKAERFDELAAKHRAASDSRYKTARAIGDCIPFGQPILVGHHSERGHRSAIAKIDTNMRKSIEHSDTADYYDNKADNARNNTAIFSDDPEAVTKMREKIAGLVAGNDRAKGINARLRKWKTKAVAIVAIAALPDSDEDKKLLGLALETCNYWANPPERINAYYMSTTGNTAEIKRLQDRIVSLERVQARGTKETTVGSVRILENAEENRLQLFFPGKPAEDMREKLKRWGFRWSPLAGAWQRHLTPSAIYAARQVLPT